jgi:hypothetical protein
MNQGRWLMLGSSALSCVLRDQLSALAACLPGIREGEDKAIHDARVATRRLRETLALAHTNLESEELQDILELIHRAGRALGDARDPDVAQRLLTDIENRLPAAAPIVVKMRSEACFAGGRLSARITLSPGRKTRRSTCGCPDDTLTVQR